MTISNQAGRPLSSDRLLLGVYLINAVLVICHEIDSAYWHEWDLFHLPGGAPGFVALHLALIPLVLVGLVLLDRGTASGRAIALLVGLGGLAGALVHGFFLWSGDERFRTTFSTGLIVAFGLSSALVVAAGIRAAVSRRLAAGS